MLKIPTLFVRNSRFYVSEEWEEKCLWVRDGEGVATEKIDGTACLIKNKRLYKRRTVKNAKPPADWIHASLDPSKSSGPGWVPVRRDVKADQWHIEAWDALDREPDNIDGTYELVGPYVQKNPYFLKSHLLVPHGTAAELDVPDRSYKGLREFLFASEIEGIVFVHEDGRMAKIKRKDYGLGWPLPAHRG